METKYYKNLNKPKVITICGSSKFCDIMVVCAWLIEQKEQAITMGEYLLPVWYSNIPDHLAESENCIYCEIDKLHKRKIDISDEIFVVNFGNYIEESTRSEIEYARKLKKHIRYYSTDNIGEEVDKIIKEELITIKGILKEIGENKMEEIGENRFEVIYNGFMTPNLALCVDGPWKGWLCAKHINGHWRYLCNIMESIKQKIKSESMTKETYYKEIKELEKKYKEDRERIMIDFAMKNKKCKIGDVIEDDCYKIKIEGINVNIPIGNNKDPEIVYYGPRLKKDGKPYKNKDCIFISENNITVGIR